MWRGAAITSLAAQWDARTPISRVKRSDGKLALTVIGSDLSQFAALATVGRQTVSTLGRER